jgi:hypothetical protein
MVTTRNRNLLLLLAALLLLSTIAVACDLDDSSKSKTCPVCFTRGSLSSAVAAAVFVVEAAREVFFLGAGHNDPSARKKAYPSGASYRGPPLPASLPAFL